jgi:hypothetical protein
MEPGRILGLYEIEIELSFVVPVTALRRQSRQCATIVPVPRLPAPAQSL